MWHGGRVVVEGEGAAAAVLTAEAGRQAVLLGKHRRAGSARETLLCGKHSHGCLSCEPSPARSRALRSFSPVRVAVRRIHVLKR